MTHLCPEIHSREPYGCDALPPLALFIAYTLHRSTTFAALSILLRPRLCFPAARDSSSYRLFITAFMLASKTIRDQGMFALREITQEECKMCSPRVAAQRRLYSAARL